MAYNTQEERLKVKGSESITRDLQVTGDVYVGGDLTVNNSTALTEADKGVSNGVASLDATGRVPYSQLPESAMEYKGTWDASTNTPTLADGTGTNGDFYIVSVAGTVNLGTVANPRNVTFYVNDRIIYDGTLHEWERLPAAEVRTVNGQTGDVVLTANDIDYDSNTTVKAEIDKKANSASLATVATTGDYDDLLNRPNIPPTVIPDAAMSDTSRNPVENKVIKKYVDGWMTATFGRELGKVWYQGTGVPTDASTQSPIYANGLWVCGSTGHGVWWSEDGKNWTQATGIPSNIDTGCLVFAGNLWLYVGNNNHIYWSENGKNWTQGVSTSVTIGGYDNKIIIKYADGIYVLGSKSAGNVHAWSEDGKNWYPWTLTFSGSNFTVSDIAYANNLWVAVTGYGLLWSEDGKNWSVGKQVDYTSGFVTYAGGRWLFSGRDGRPRGVGIWWSDDGKSWTQGTGIDSTYVMQYPVYANGFWICGSQSHGMWWSTDGKSWTQGTGDNTSYTMQYLVYANGFWICGSSSHGAWWSTDGKSWTQGTGTNTSYTMPYLTYANGLWVCGSYDHGIWWSEDGKNWTQGTGANASYSMQYLVYANGLWVCGSQNHGMWHGRNLNDLIADGTITL